MYSASFGVRGRPIERDSIAVDHRRSLRTTCDTTLNRSDDHSRTAGTSQTVQVSTLGDDGHTFDALFLEPSSASRINAPPTPCRGSSAPTPKRPIRPSFGISDGM